MTPYRKYAAEGAVRRCREIGVALLANGTGVHAIPAHALDKHPGLLQLVQRYRVEIMQHLDGIVE